MTRWHCDHRKPRRAVIGLRVTPSQRAAIEAEAANHGLRLSDWLRLRLGIETNTGEAA